GLLGGVGGVLGVTERAQRHVVDGGLIDQHQLVEGARIAALRCLQRSRLGDATVGDGGHQRSLALPRNQRDRRRRPTNYTTPQRSQTVTRVTLTEETGVRAQNLLNVPLKHAHGKPWCPGASRGIVSAEGCDGAAAPACQEAEDQLMPE